MSPKFSLPGWTDVTPSPTDSTIQPASWPRMHGNFPKDHQCELLHFDHASQTNQKTETKEVKQATGG